MTAAVMKSFGVNCVLSDNYVEIPAPQTYQAQHYTIEPDASAASYFLAAAAITDGDATVLSLGPTVYKATFDLQMY